MITVTIECPKCGSTNLVKNGKSKSGHQKCHCKDCNAYFQLNYTYNACREGVEEQVWEMSLNGSGTRDIGRVLSISKDTVTSILKKKEPVKVNPEVLGAAEMNELNELEVEVCLHVEADEQWSYVQKKENQRWLWYIRACFSGRILAYTLGKRTDEVFKELQESVAHLPIKCWYTDNWGAYHRQLPIWQSHIVDKANMQGIERQNLNFRTHIKRLQRKTICFSKSEEVHDKVIGTYINKFCYKYGSYSQATKSEYL